MQIDQFLLETLLCRATSSCPARQLIRRFDEGGPFSIEASTCMSRGAGSYGMVVVKPGYRKAVTFCCSNSSFQVLTI